MSAQQAEPSGVVHLGAASGASRRAPARASSRRTRTAASALAATTPVTLEALCQRLEALTAAVERMAAHQPLVDLQTAADHLGVSTRTLRRMVERQEVSFRRIGRTLRFNLALLAPRA